MLSKKLVDIKEHDLVLIFDGTVKARMVMQVTVLPSGDWTIVCRHCHAKVLGELSKEQLLEKINTTMTVLDYFPAPEMCVNQIKANVERMYVNE